MLKPECADGGSALLGDAAFVDTERAIAEFRAGRPVAISEASRTILALPADGLNDDRRLAAFRSLCSGIEPVLAVTERRAQKLGIEAGMPVALTLASDDDSKAIHALAVQARVGRPLDWQPAGPLAAAALQLAKLAYRLPAVLTVTIEPERLAPLDPAVVCVEAEEIGRFRERAVHSLAIASQASIPLHGGIQARFVIFRGVIGGEQAAIVVNEPDFSRPVAVRLHSACLTGDVFGSRRCDCGDQLRLALKQIADRGGGVILYLDQEGRGVGLANKMRTYGLQDAGYDTVDANFMLGFEDDERDYGIAGRMLDMLGCRKVMLMTNNPAKIDGLADAGIEIASRVPLVTPVNGDNRRYLAAKAMRAGHTLDHLFDALASDEAAIVPDKAEAAS